MIRAVFFDIDGTLVSFKTHRAPASALKALESLHQKGIRLFISSGRPPLMLDDVKKGLNDFPFDGYILMNGQCCCDADGKIFYRQALPRSAFKELLPWLEENSDVVCSFVEMDYAYENRHNDRTVQECLSIGLKGPRHAVDDPSRALTHETYQLNPYIPEEKEAEFIAHAPGCRAVRWNSVFADVIPADGGKPEGVRRMLERFGFSRGECMAFGDGGNDIDMLKYASIGVAMGNASANVKEAADYVTADIDDDGIEKALKYFGLLD